MLSDGEVFVEEGEDDKIAERLATMSEGELRGMIAWAIDRYEEEKKKLTGAGEKDRETVVLMSALMSAVTVVEMELSRRKDAQG